MTPAEKIITYVRKMGSDATSLRDASHEAHHALNAGLVKRWDRTTIDHAIMRKVRSIKGRIDEEIMARAVEQIVCADLGVECESIEACATTAILEACHYRQVFLNADAVAPAIRAVMTTKPAREFADRILSLAERS